MRTRRSTRRVAWGLALGWAVTGGLVEPLGAEMPNAPVTVEEHAPNPIDFTAASVAKTSAATNAAVTASTTTAQDCDGTGFCVNVVDVTTRIPFTGVGVRFTCDICECTTVENGRLQRTSWCDCGTEIVGVTIF